MRSAGRVENASQKSLFSTSMKLFSPSSFGFTKRNRTGLFSIIGCLPPEGTQLQEKLLFLLIGIKVVKHVRGPLTWRAEAHRYTFRNAHNARVARNPHPRRITEERNAASKDLDRMRSLEIIRLMNPGGIGKVAPRGRFARFPAIAAGGG